MERTSTVSKWIVKWSGSHAVEQNDLPFESSPATTIVQEARSSFQEPNELAHRKELPDLAGLFKLTKDGTKTFKKFSSSEHQYRVEIAALPQIFSPDESMVMMPKILSNVMDLCFEAFDKSDRVCVSLSSVGLERPIFLTMRKLSDFNIEAFLHSIELLNSQRKLVVDESFVIRVFRTVMPQGGGSKRKHQHVSRDAKRFKRSIVSVTVDNNSCLAAALFLGKFRLTHDISGLDRSKWNNFLGKSGSTRLAKQAQQLLTACQLPVGHACDLEDLDRLQEKLFPEFQIKVVSADHGNMVIHRVPEEITVGMQEIYLLLDNKHFDLITTPSGFHCSSYYCSKCDRPYDHKERHVCGGICRLCYRSQTQCVPDTVIRCEDCGRCFGNQQCFDTHKVLRKNGRSYCDDLFVCPGCGIFVSLLRRKKKKHECGEIFCKICCGFFLQATHQCYFKPLEHIPAEKVRRFIFFDYETYNDPELGHMPACIVAQYADGTEFRFPADGEPMTKDVGNQFGKWLFSEQHRGFTIIAHNFSGYDGHFILRYMLDNRLKGISVIKRGNQLLEIRYPALNIRSRDTLNFLPVALAKLSQAVGLEIAIHKGDFPHKLNRPDNWDKVLPWPLPEMYMIDRLKLKDRELFLEWHEEAKVAAGGIFNFREELMRYCSIDVYLLRIAALKFCDDYEALTSLNPLESVTIPAACHRYFRTFLLPTDKVAVLSTSGPHRNRRTSVQATQWLEWMNMSADGKIRHGRNGKEQLIGRYYVDGIDEEKKTVYEYNGCVFHGHPCCTEPCDQVPFSTKTMQEAWEEFKERVLYLNSRGYTVLVKWSCEWLQERQVPDVASFLHRLNIREPLNPHDAFKGGRTNACRLYYEVADGEKILHYDVVSLYPYVNKTKEYPVGHPVIIVSNFLDVREYYGFVYCKVLPPGQCLFPVLPTTINGKLMFTLCRQCAVMKSISFCSHSAEDRALEGVWVTTELHHALEKGYQVLEIYEVWHWVEKESGLLAEYMNKFLKIKMEASGWPSWCVTKDKKDEYVQIVKEREGIVLDVNNIKSDPGRKSVAKLCLNSLWGKFGQRDDFSVTKFISDAKQYLDLNLSRAVEIQDVFGVSEETLMVTYCKNPEYNEGNNTSNMAIAAFTTANARLILLNLMEKLDDRLLYYDTDSVIFVQRPGDWLPPTGNVLGEWDNQLEKGESHIVKFVSCGPKVYSYETDTGRLELKVKGMTQNGFTENIIDWDSVTESFKRTGRALDFNQLKRLLDGTDDSFKVLYPEHIKRNARTQEINTVQLLKTLQLVYDKRVLLADFTTVPFGSVTGY